ncbi:hypothetical protein CRYUN_Cryun02cG0108300 [Craigia yunnanensis]
MPWTMKKHISHIKAFKGQLVGWDIVHIPREGNDIADKLAKSGVNRLFELVVVYVS